MGYTVTQIEIAIQAALQANAEVVAAAPSRNIILLNTLDREDLETIAQLGISVGIISLEGKYASDIGQVSDEDGGFGIVVVVPNLRGATSAQTGSVADPGLWEVVEHCRAALHHHSDRLGLEIHDIAVVKRRLLFAGNRGAAAVLECRVQWRHTK